MARLSAWLLASGLSEGPVFRRINVLTSPPDPAGQRVVRHYIGAKSLTRQGVVAILRRRVLEAIDLGHVELEPGMERSEEHTSELQSLMRISYSVFCLKKKKQ